MNVMISEDRLKHIIGVARRCYELATEKNWDNDACIKMFIIGFLHDIGYEFSDNRGHAEAGADMLNTIDFPSAVIIRKHGRPLPIERQPAELRILNQADIETSATGEKVSAEQRLQDVESRYGRESIQYKNMEKLCKELKLI